MDVNIDTNAILSFINRNKIRNQSAISNGLYKACFVQFFNLVFEERGLLWVNGSFILEKMGHIEPCVDAMFNDKWIKPRNLGI